MNVINIHLAPCKITIKRVSPEEAWDGRIKKTRHNQQNIHFFSVMDIDLWYSGRAETTACFTTAKLCKSTSQGLSQHRHKGAGQAGGSWEHPRAPGKCVTEARTRLWQGHEQTWLHSAHSQAGLWHLTGAWHWGLKWGPVPWVGWQRCHGGCWGLLVPSVPW